MLCIDVNTKPIRTIKTFFYKLILAVFLTLSAAGEETVSVDRSEAIGTAFRNNRELAIANLEIKRAASRLRWSGRLDNPEFEFSISEDDIGLDDGEGNYEVALSQRFPLTSKLKREKDLRRHQVLLAEAEIAERRRELAHQIDEAIVELLATRESIRLQEKLVELNREIVQFLKAQADQGLISSLEVTQASLNGRSLEQASRSLQTQETQQRIVLNRLMGLDAETNVNIEQGFGLPATQPATEADLGSILARRPDHVLALAKIDEADAALAFENAKRWEDVSVKLFVEGEDAVDEPTGLESNTFAGFGVSIPLPLRKRNQEGIEQAQIDREEADRGVEAARFRIKSEAEEAYRLRLDAWELAREASGEILALAEKNLEEFRDAYTKGQSSLLQVQRAQEQILEVRSAATQFVGDYHRADAQVRFATGDYPGLAPSSHSSK